MKQKYILLLIFSIILLLIILLNYRKEYFNSFTKKYYYIDNGEPSNVTEGYFKYTRPLELFKNDSIFEYKKMNFEDFLIFLNNIKLSKTQIYILYFNTRSNESINQRIKLLKISKNISKNINIILCSPFDWWYNKNRTNNYNFYVQNAFKSNRFKYIIDINYKTLGFFLNQNLDKYKNNIIQWKAHNCYNKCFVKFNSNPIEKILISGALGYAYYERKYLLKFKNTKFKKNKNYFDHKNEDGYSKYLNKYLCCFSSTVNPQNLTLTSQNKKVTYYPTHSILLKNYEILGSGSLLLNPSSEKPYLKEIGLIEDVNCMFIDMSDDKKIQDKIDFILNPKNRKFIDKVRKTGQDHGIKNLNSKKKYEELKNIILKL